MIPHAEFEESKGQSITIYSGDAPFPVWFVNDLNSLLEKLCRLRFAEDKMDDEP